MFVSPTRVCVVYVFVVKEVTSYHPGGWAWRVKERAIKLYTPKESMRCIRS